MLPRTFVLAEVNLTAVTYVYSLAVPNLYRYYKLIHSGHASAPCTWLDVCGYILASSGSQCCVLALL